jgi:hypothetical protein
MTPGEGTPPDVSDRRQKPDRDQAVSHSPDNHRWRQHRLGSSGRGTPHRATVARPAGRGTDLRLPRRSSLAGQVPNAQLARAAGTVTGTEITKFLRLPAVHLVTSRHRLEPADAAMTARTWVSLDVSAVKRVCAWRVAARSRTLGGGRASRPSTLASDDSRSRPAACDQPPAARGQRFADRTGRRASWRSGLVRYGHDQECVPGP